MNVVVNGLMTSYHKRGAGKTIILLHGWGDSAATFSVLINELEKEYTVIAPDLPGFGGTETPATAWGLEDYAGFVSDWLKKIGVEKPVLILGHSFGGSLATVGLSSKVLNSEKLILLASSGVRDRKSTSRRLIRAGAKLAKVPLYLMPAGTSASIKRKIYKKAGSDLFLVPHMRQTFTKIIRQDIQSAAKKVSQPTLLIYGEKDKETPRVYGELLARAIPKSQLHIVPGAGHFLHHQQPQRIGMLIKQFLAQGSSR